MKGLSGMIRRRNSMMQTMIRVLRSKNGVYVNKTDLVSALLRETIPKPGTQEEVLSEARQCLVKYLRTMPEPGKGCFCTMQLVEETIDGELKLDCFYYPENGGLFLNTDDLLEVIKIKNKIALKTLRHAPRKVFERYKIAGTSGTSSSLG